MSSLSIPDLVKRLIALCDGNTEEAARRLGTSSASLSRWQSGRARPRRHLEERLRVLSSDSVGPFSTSLGPATRVEQLEEAIANTLHALREEFHRTSSLSTRQETLDLVAALFFAHVTSIDTSGFGIGTHLQTKGKTAVASLNQFMLTSLAKHLPIRNGEAGEAETGRDRFFSPLAASDERFAQRLLHIFEGDAAAFRALHEAGRDDLINEVFSRFMSTSFVDEKEMGQYLTPPEIVRFMVQVGFRALAPQIRAQLLECSRNDSGFVLDSSCGVGSFLAETTRLFYSQVRKKHGDRDAASWLSYFLRDRIVGIDKSERMIRLAMINLGLFGAKAANVRLANALERAGHDGELNSNLEGRVQLILTNPPFGATYKGADVSAFAMGQNRSNVDSEVLFLERYIDWLAPGGVVATVVPDSVLVNRGIFTELRAWLGKRCSVEAVFSMPPRTFAAAGTSTKTSVLLLRKFEHSRVSNKSTYFGEAKEVGFDVVTRSGQRRRIRSSRTDLPLLLAEYGNDEPIKVGRNIPLTGEVKRWDAAFHIGLPKEIAAIMDHPESALLTVADVATLVDERIDPRRRGTAEFTYVEISDIDSRTGLVGHKQLLAAEAPSRARKLIRTGDVLMSTVRPERGAIGLIPADLDGAVCSTGFAVFRCFAIHPLALVWLLKTAFVRRQMIRSNSGIAYPAISEEVCLGLVLPAARENIEALSAGAEALAQSQEAFEQARKALIAQISSTALGEGPDLVDGAEPGSVSDVA